MNARPDFLRAAEIHTRIGPAWPAILAQLGIAEEHLRPRKSGPCPNCGGTNRYTFDNRKGRGDFICRGCGAGDGFALLERVHGWTFSEARRRVLDAAGIVADSPRQAAQDVNRAVIAPPPATPVAAPPARVRSIARSACAVADCPDAASYLESRGLWPLPAGCTLKAHAALDYWNEGQHVGRYPGLVAEVRDLAGELVTSHVTYLENGRKLEGREPRKILSKVEGRQGCAVRLTPATEMLGIAEGIETALSAALFDGVPTWAALNTSFLAKFEPPAGVSLLRIYGDRDEPGLLAVAHLMERLQGRIRFELRVPAAPHKDFNDQLTARTRAGENRG